PLFVYQPRPFVLNCGLKNSEVTRRHGGGTEDHGASGQRSAGLECGGLPPLSVRQLAAVGLAQRWHTEAGCGSAGSKLPRPKRQQAAALQTGHSAALRASVLFWTLCAAALPEHQNE